GFQRPVAVGRSRDITDQDREIGGLTRWRDFHLFARCRGEANAQRKSVHERSRDDSAPRHDCKKGDEGLRDHRLFPSEGGVDTLNDLADRSRSSARAIAAPEERLRLPHGFASIARHLTGELPESGGKVWEESPSGAATDTTARPDLQNAGAIG